MRCSRMLLIPRLRHIPLQLMLALAGLTGVLSCAREGLDAVREIPSQPVQLALHLRSDPSTKADVSTITEIGDSPTFRGLQQIRVVPFASESAVTATDRTLSSVLALPSIASTGLVQNNNSHLFSDGGLFLPVTTASMLAYGKAPRSVSGNSIAGKHKDGSLVEIGIGTSYAAYASEIGFSPETMLDPNSGTPQTASDIADVLTAIVNGNPFQITAHYGTNQTTSVSVPWDGEIGDEQLRECFESITADGALIPGSGSLVEVMLNDLYQTLWGYNIVNSHPYEVEKDGVVYQTTKDNGDPLTYGDLYRGVRSVILGRFAAQQQAGILDITAPTETEIEAGVKPEVSFALPAYSDYPESLGLPSGAAVVRWTPAGYVVPLENGLDGIAPISAFCYPPALYYYVNTTIQTSNDNSAAGIAERAGAYNSSNSWTQILAKYSDGHAVSTNTCAVVLKDPLEYAVGMLQATVQASSDNLQDNDGLEYTTVEISGDKFPLTGVILGRQYPQHFDFTPDYISEADSKQYYLFDDQITGINLHKKAAGETLTDFRTLSLQTPVGKDVYFALEFLNNSGSSFHGAEGRILPGHRFYLVGKLSAPTSGAYNCVFQKDYITEAHCVVKTLKNAHSAVPDMGIPQLSLGVETQVNWVLSTPATVMLE